MPRKGTACLSRWILQPAVFVFLPALGGCHSAYIAATVRNATGGAVSLLEVDYPSASFGKESLSGGAEFHYRFKVLGSGGTKVLWTDAQHQEHTVAGLKLQEGDEGALTITLTPSGAAWDTHIQHKH